MGAPQSNQRMRGGNEVKNVWILGRQYDLHSRGSREALMNEIDRAKAERRAGDLSMICYTLLGAVLPEEKTSERT